MTVASNTPQPDDAALLQSLIEDLPRTTQRWDRPVSLRSTAEHRRAALQHYRLRNWVDSSLLVGERLLAAAAVLIFCYWLIDGPGRDWLYAAQHPASAQQLPIVVAPQTSAAAAPRLVASPPNPATLASRLPSIGDYGRSAVERDFISPGGTITRSMTPTSALPSKLIIPAISVDSPVKETFVRSGEWEVADYAAGYLSGTGLPGEAGNMVFAGHAGIRGSVFKDIGSLKSGDEIQVEAAGWRYRYRVSETITVWPTQTEVLDPTQKPTLTLMTCTNWDTQRLIVRADLLDARPLSA